MKLSNMQISGFGYLNNMSKVGNDSIIVIHLDSTINGVEDMWLHCTACKEITDYLEKELSDDLRKCRSVMIGFRAEYQNFSEAFFDPVNSDERVVIFNAKLDAIDAVYVNGSRRTVYLRKAIAV